jgi:hypothetical protein
VIDLLMLQHPEHKQHRSAKEHHHELGRFAKWEEIEVSRYAQREWKGWSVVSVPEAETVRAYVWVQEGQSRRPGH